MLGPACSCCGSHAVVRSWMGPWMGLLMVGDSTCSCLYICTCIYVSVSVYMLPLMAVDCCERVSGGL